MTLAGHFVPALAVAFPALVTVVLLDGDFQGHSSPRVWFAWHPILMSIAFPCLMVLGRWSYVAGAADWGVESKGAQRILHGIFMSTATVVMLAGYLCIVFAHYPNKQYFGYNFTTGEWTEWKRVVHVYSGYAAILLAVQQALVGSLKFLKLQEGTKAFTFHGKLGKLNILLGGFALMVAVWFWGWSDLMKKILLIVLGLVMAFIALTSTPPAKAEEAKLVLAGVGLPTNSV